MHGPSLNCSWHGIVRLLSGLFLTTGLALVPGCGLVDYEAKMEQQQRKMDYVRAENESLEPFSLRLPERKSKEKNAVSPDELFLRPPRGISTKADDKTPGAYAVYRPTGVASGIQELQVSLVKNDKSSSWDQFQTEARQRFGVAASPIRRKIAPPSGPAFEIDEYAGPGFFLYLYKSGSFQLAIHFKVPTNTNSTGPDPRIGYSLATLKVGSAAVEQHRKWKAPPVEAAPKGPRPNRIGSGPITYSGKASARSSRRSS